jgi:hypothetical protein
MALVEGELGLSMGIWFQEFALAFGSRFWSFNWYPFYGTQLRSLELLFGCVLSLVVFSLLDALHLVVDMSSGEVTTLGLRGAMDHVFPFVVLVLLQWDVRWFPVVVIALIGWILLTPLLSNWFDTILTLFVLTPVLCRLLALALGFDFASGMLRGLLVDRHWRMAIGDQRWPSSLTRWCQRRTSFLGTMDKRKWSRYVVWRPWGVWLLSSHLVSFALRRITCG